MQRRATRLSLTPLTLTISLTLPVPEAAPGRYPTFGYVRPLSSSLTTCTVVDAYRRAIKGIATMRSMSARNRKKLEAKLSLRHYEG